MDTLSSLHLACALGTQSSSACAEQRSRPGLTACGATHLFRKIIVSPGGHWRNPPREGGRSAAALKNLLTVAMSNTRGAGAGNGASGVGVALAGAAKAKGDVIALGIEGSANKCGVGIIRRDGATGEYVILSNPRKTYITPPGCGFLPRETAWHHQQVCTSVGLALRGYKSPCWSQHVTALVKLALPMANIRPCDVDVICYTRGTCARGAWTLSMQLTGRPGCRAWHGSTACIMRRVCPHARPAVEKANRGGQPLRWAYVTVSVHGGYAMHCPHPLGGYADIEMGRIVTGGADPVVLYVSGGNTQVICYSMNWYAAPMVALLLLWPWRTSAANPGVTATASLARPSTLPWVTAWTVLLDVSACRTTHPRATTSSKQQRSKSDLASQSACCGAAVSQPPPLRVASGARSLSSCRTW